MIIKINLIGRRAKPTTSRAQLLLFAGLLVVEALFLFVWYQKLSSELDTVKSRVKEANSKLDELKRVKQAWEQWQAEKADLDRQTQVFESLKAEQIGPPTMLEYVSYVLTKVPDDASGADELKAQELVGWNHRESRRKGGLHQRHRGTHRGAGQATGNQGPGDAWRRDGARASIGPGVLSSPIDRY